MCMFILKLKLSGQTNLVPNPSFEIYTTCPTLPGQVYFASPWFQPNMIGGSVTIASSSDLYNQCASFGFTSVPTNTYVGGFQNARTGVGYCGIGLKNPSAITSREYIETTLSSKLLKGKTYCVEFYVSLADTSLYAISDIGIFFSNDSLLYNSAVGTNIPVLPQIENINTNIIIDTMNWVLISGQFIASGGENFITIGNFRDNLSTTTQTVSGVFPYAYYYFDDISVICCDCDTLIPQPELMIPTLIGGSQNFEIKGLPVSSTLYLFNSLGQTVYYNSAYNNAFNTINLSSGIYYYYLKLSNGDLYKGKLCVIK